MEVSAECVSRARLWQARLVRRYGPRWVWRFAARMFRWLKNTWSRCATQRSVWSRFLDAAQQQSMYERADLVGVLVERLEEALDPCLSALDLRPEARAVQ